jgi:hypothetical protein
MKENGLEICRGCKECKTYSENINEPENIYYCTIALWDLKGEEDILEDNFEIPDECPYTLEHLILEEKRG